MEANQTASPAPFATGRELPLAWAAVAVTGIGALVVLAGMFMPHLSSWEVAFISDNMMIQNEPVDILCVIAAVVGGSRYVSSGTKAAARTVWWAGLWFAGWSVKDAYTGQLQNLSTHATVETTAGAGLWAVGVGSLIVAAGGLMMRYPHKEFGVAGIAMPAAEQGFTPVGATKNCPRCAETVKAAATICRFCKHEFKQE